MCVCMLNVHLINTFFLLCIFSDQLIFQSTPSHSFHIIGQYTGLFLCFNKHGRLVAKMKVRGFFLFFLLSPHLRKCFGLIKQVQTVVFTLEHKNSSVRCDVYCVVPLALLFSVGGFRCCLKC